MKLVATFGLLLMLSACMSPPQQTLYQDLGGSRGIENLSGRFIYYLGQEPVLREFFVNSDLDRFQEKFSEQICVISGGPCTYTGEPMELVHRGHDIKESEFNLLVEVFVDAMTDEGIDFGTQNRLLKELAPLRSDVVEDKMPQRTP